MNFIVFWINSQEISINIEFNTHFDKKSVVTRGEESSKTKAWYPISVYKTQSFWPLPDKSIFLKIDIPYIFIEIEIFNISIIIFHFIFISSGKFASSSAKNFRKSLPFSSVAFISNAFFVSSSNVLFASMSFSKLTHSSFFRVFWVFFFFDISEVLKNCWCLLGWHIIFDE